MVCTIQFGSYNIQANVYLGIFQDTKVTVGGGVYTRESGGYQVTATVAPSPHRGGVAIFYCEEDHFNLEVLQINGPTVFRFCLAPVGYWWRAVGCYISLD